MASFIAEDHSSVVQSEEREAVRMLPIQSRELQQLLIQDALNLEETYLETLQFALDLLLETPGGMLIGVVPAGLKSLVKISSLDKGYMRCRIGGLHVASSYVVSNRSTVRQALLEFAEHTSADRWPSDHCDPAARDQPKDGATLFSSTSSVIAAAARLDHPPIRFKIESGGTRHQGGLGLAEWLARNLVRGKPGGAVFLKSDSGSMKVFFPRKLKDQGAAYYVCDTSPSFDFVDGAAFDRTKLLKSVADAATLWDGDGVLRAALQTVRSLDVGIEAFLSLTQYPFRDDGVMTARCWEMKRLIDSAVLDLALTSRDKGRRILGLHSLIALLGSPQLACPLHFASRVFSTLTCPTASWCEEEAAAVALYKMPVKLVAQEYAEAAASVFDSTQSSRKKVLVAWLLCKVPLFFRTYAQQRTLSAEVAQAGLQESDGGSLPYAQNVMNGDGFEKLEATANKLTSTSFLVRDLRADFGFTKSDLIELGCRREKKEKVNGFIKVGFQADDFRRLGITVNELIQAGFTTSELIQVGYGELRDLIRAGWEAAGLRKVGFTVSDFVAAGWRERDLIFKAGFKAADLRAAGFTVSSSIVAGCGERDLIITAGFKAADFREAGIAVRQLIEAGCGERDLIRAGFTVADLLAAGFTERDLKKAVQHLFAAGFTQRDLIEAGFKRPSSTKLSL